MYKMTIQNILVITFTLFLNTAVILIFRNIFPLFERFNSKYYFSFYIFFSAFWIASIWFGIFVVYRFPVSGDVILFFQPQGRAAMSGGIPTVDFNTSYMPLFPYITGLVDKIFLGNIYGIGIFFVICLWIDILLLWKIFRIEYTDSEKMVFGLIAIINGAITILSIGYQQDETWMLLWLEIGIFLLIEKKEWISGIIMGIGLLTTKILFGIFCITLFFIAQDRYKFVFGISLPIILIGALLLTLGVDPWTIINVEAGAFAPPSLISIISFSYDITKFIHHHPLLIRSFLGIIIITIIVVISKKHNNNFSVNIAIRIVMIAWLIFLILSQKSLTSYRIPLLIFLPFLLKLSKGSFWVDIVWIIYNFAIAIEYMLYEDYVRNYFPYYKFLQHVQSLGHLDWRVIFVIILDFIIILSETYFIIRFIKESYLVNE